MSTTDMRASEGLSHLLRPWARVASPMAAKSTTSAGMGLVQRACSARRSSSPAPLVVAPAAGAGPAGGGLGR
ncbi:hypothetical protein, partial [Mycobacterium avium]|uniref:hypothetical protein n=1 Tax=Mycobacterium avium TaxID=1764 RepID=UPI001F46E476